MTTLTHILIRTPISRAHEINDRNQSFTSDYCQDNNN